MHLKYLVFKGAMLIYFFIFTLDYHIVVGLRFYKSDFFPRLGLTIFLYMDLSVYFYMFLMLQIFNRLPYRVQIYYLCEKFGDSHKELDTWLVHEHILGNAAAQPGPTFLPA